MTLISYTLYWLGNISIPLLHPSASVHLFTATLLPPPKGVVIANLIGQSTGQSEDYSRPVNEAIGLIISTH